MDKEFSFYNDNFMLSQIETYSRFCSKDYYNLGRLFLSYNLTLDFSSRIIFEILCIKDHEFTTSIPSTVICTLSTKQLFKISEYGYRIIHMLNIKFSISDIIKYINEMEYYYTERSMYTLDEISDSIEELLKLSTDVTYENIPCVLTDVNFCFVAQLNNIPLIINIYRNMKVSRLIYMFNILTGWLIYFDKHESLTFVLRNYKNFLKLNSYYDFGMIGIYSDGRIITMNNKFVTVEYIVSHICKPIRNLRSYQTSEILFNN